MNQIPPINLRPQETNAIRRWAELEGKSAAMTADLLRRQAALDSSRPHSRLPFAVLTELIVLAVHAIRLFRTG